MKDKLIIFFGLLFLWGLFWGVYQNARLEQQIAINEENEELIRSLYYTINEMQEDPVIEQEPIDPDNYCSGE